MHVSSSDMRFTDGGFLEQDKLTDSKLMTSSNVTSANVWPRFDEISDCNNFEEFSNNSMDDYPVTDVIMQQDTSLKSNYVIGGGDVESDNVSNIELGMWSDQMDTKSEKWEHTSGQLRSFDGEINPVKAAESNPYDPAVCQGCSKSIEDRFLLSIGGYSWHEDCAECAICRIKLSKSCFVGQGQLFCKRDYQNTHKKCAGCESHIDNDELVMRVMTSPYVYHVGCFACVTCKRLLRKGDEFVLMESHSQQLNQNSKDLQCKLCWTNKAPAKPITSSSSEPAATSSSPGVSSDITDSILSPKSPSCVLSPKSDDDDALSSDDESTSGNLNSSKDENGEDRKRSRDEDGDVKDGKRSKRPRTILNAVQRRAFKAAFEVTPKPCRKVRETLAKDTGLTVRVVQVWFQNQRAKMKKLAKRQQSQEAAAMKAREEFGFHGFDPLAPIPHQIQSIIPGSDIIMDPVYGQFHQQMAIQSQIQAQHAMAPGWDQPGGEMPMFSNQFRQEPSRYQEVIGAPPNVTMTTPIDIMTSQPNVMRLGNQQMTQHIMMNENGFHGSMHARGAMNRLFPSDVHVTSSQDIIKLSPTHINNDVTTPIDGLYSMQNNYFSS